MPLTKVRVPRQAATAAKAAIKKDLLQHSSRPSAASVPAKAPTVAAGKAVDSNKKTASTQQQKKSQQAKVRSYVIRCTLFDRLLTFAVAAFDAPR